MTLALIVRQTSPSLSIQDGGRPGFLTYGMSRGGAADPLAMAEGAALLGQDTELAGIEMAAMGGVFEATEDLRIALTGAPMRASIDGVRVVWNASHLLPKGAVLTIGAAETGVYGYLTLGGGVAVDALLGARGTHFAAGLGGVLEAGAELPVGPDKGGPVGRTLDVDNRFDGGTVRMVASLQTHLFPAEEIARFEATVFHRDIRSNRMGARLDFEGEGFSPEGGLSILSEVIVRGDIQITGDGTPFALMCECGTTGGYPRIGTILPSEMARVAQSPAKADLRFSFVSLEQAVEIEARAAKVRGGLKQSVVPLVRDPWEMADLLSYDLISGVTDGEFVI